MSTALAIASVSAVLREILQDALVDHGVSTIVSGATVTAVSPDQVGSGNTQPTGINVFCYGASPNPGWRNAGLPSRSGVGDRLTNAPLALDLHYLVTAYGTDDFHAEVLLGHAMHRLHEVPVLERETIRNILQDPTILSGRLADSGLADQVELVKITPEVMGIDDMSKLWTALGGDYRPSGAYRATVVLIQAEEALRSALPVLTRGGRDPVTGAEEGVTVVAGLVVPYPTLTEVRPPDEQLVAQVGDSVSLIGHHLTGTDHAVEFRNERFDVTHVISPPDSVAETLIETTISGGLPGDWAVGLYTVHVSVTQDGIDRTTNTLPMVLGPTINTAGIVVGTVGTTTTIDVPVTPAVRPEQAASLIVGQREVPAEDHPALASTLTFILEDAEPGTHFVRLRIDGVESVLVDRAASPPEFDTAQRVTI